MDCDRWREAISATLDGEDALLDPALVDAHLRRCPPCRAFADRARHLHAPMRIGPAPVMPDLSRRVRRLHRLADRAAAWSVARALLTVVALQIVVLAVQSIVSAPGGDADAHVSRHLGAFAMAYGVGLLLVAARPARARTMLPVAAVVAGALIITAVVDLAGGRIPLRGEVLHLPELVSVMLLWLMADPGRTDAVRRRLPSRRSTSPVASAESPERQAS